MFCVPNSIFFSSDVLRFRNLKRIGLLIFVVTGFNSVAPIDQPANAGSKLYFSGKSRVLNTDNRASMRQHGVSHRANRSRRNVGKHYRFKRYRNQYSFKNTYQGPKVIYVNRELVRRGLRIRVNGVNARSQSVTPHLSEYAPGLPRTIYFNDKACRSGMSCSIYLGANRSSPKIIVVGEKKPKRSQKPVIIYPPS